MSQTHELKIDKEFYLDVATKIKKFEVRKNDRNYQVNDNLILCEWDKDLEKETGNRCDAIVDYILQGGKHGIQRGYVVMGISVTATRKKY